MESKATRLTMNRPRVFLDADVIFAGSAAPSQFGSSQVILLMGEITLLDCITSEQAITEVERNLSAKLPHKLAAFRFLVDRCLHVIADPTLAEIEPFMRTGKFEGSANS